MERLRFCAVGATLPSGVGEAAAGMAAICSRLRGARRRRGGWDGQFRRVFRGFGEGVAERNGGEFGLRTGVER
jgi:hypothetical protein